MGLEEQLFDAVLQSNIGQTVLLLSLGANPESLICRFKRCFNESGSPKSNLSEPSTSQNAKRIKLG